jgi:putative membrane protein
MMGYYYGPGAAGWMWLVGSLMMLLFWGGLFAVVVWVTRALIRGRSTEELPDEILKRRLAAGQITPEEYEQTSRILQG